MKFNRWVMTLMLLQALRHVAGAPAGPIVDLAHLPPNTWVALNYTTDRPAGFGGATDNDKGDWGTAGWNKLVYDPDAKRVLFYDRWLDKRHGGGTIYGNCLFSFDATLGKVTPLRVDNWDVQHNANGTYWTVARPENATEPTPCPRHVYQAFDYVPEGKSVFICNGANGTAAVGGKLVWEKECENTWQLNLSTMTWRRFETRIFPPNELDAAMAYCPDIRSIVYTGKGKIWIFDLAIHQWRKAKNNAPTGGGGQSIVYDPPRKRMLLAGGMMTDASVHLADRLKKDPGCNKLYAFDPHTEAVTPLADCPTALYEATLAFDSKHDLFVTSARMRFPADGLPTGTFCYDPTRDTWESIAGATPPPDPGVGLGWMRVCYDPGNDCFVGLLIYDRWYAMRYVRPMDSPSPRP